jgi:hypothetical protein
VRHEGRVVRAAVAITEELVALDGAVTPATLHTGVGVLDDEHGGAGFGGSTVARGGQVLVDPGPLVRPDPSP